MQTKSSYRALKWTFIFGAMATLGTACVVTSGDGGDDELGDGGESGSTSVAGKNSTAGTGGSTSTAGTTSGGSAGTATTAGGAGGEPATYQVGLCDNDEPDVTKGISSGKFPTCAPTANDDGQDCKKCLKDKCCETWQICYGSEPHIACGWGTTEAADGQWDCIENCIVANEAGDVSVDDVVATCSAACTNQCANDDGGNILIATSDLIRCAQKEDTCLDACFPLNL